MYLEIMAEMRENSVMKMSTVWNMLVPRHRFSPSGFSQNWFVGPAHSPLSPPLPRLTQHAGSAGHECSLKLACGPRSQSALTTVVWSSTQHKTEVLLAGVLGQNVPYLTTL